MINETFIDLKQAILDEENIKTEIREIFGR